MKPFITHLSTILVLCAATLIQASEEQNVKKPEQEDPREYFNYKLAYELAGNFERGKELATQTERFPRSCRFCHGNDGIAPGDHHPNLAGQKDKYLRQQLISFIFLQRRSHIMNQTMVDFKREKPLYSEQEIADLSTYFSSLNPVGDGKGDSPSEK